MALELSILAIFGGFGLLAAGAMARLYPLAICVVLGLAFCQGLASLAGIPGAIYGLAIDASILLILGVAYTMCRTRSVPFQAPAFSLILGLAFVFLVSAFLNYSDGFTSYRMFRNVIFPYLFFLAIYNLPITEREFLRITKFVGVFLVIQIGAAIVKFGMWGVREGGMIGTFGTQSGAMSTIFPLFCIGFLLSVYLVYDRNPIFLWLCLGFVFFAWGGGKRAFFVVLPIFLMGLYVFYLVKERGKTFSGEQITKASVIVILLCMPLIYFAGRMTPTLNPEREIGGSFDLNHIVRYVEHYHFGYHETADGIVHGRMATFRVAVDYATRRFDKFFFGYGPDSIHATSRSDEILQERFGVSSFRTGFNRYLISLGVLGTAFLVWFYVYLGLLCLKCFDALESRYWRAINMGVIFACAVFVFDFFNYSVSFVHGYIPSMLFLFAVAAVLRNAPMEQDEGREFGEGRFH